MGKVDAGASGAVVPIALAALVALGGFESGAHAAAATVSALVLLLLALAGVLTGGVGDPLALRREQRGATVRLLPWALIAVLCLSRSLSQVPRAGLVGVVLATWMLVSVPAIARALGSAERRRVAGTGFAAVLTAVATWGVADWLTGSPRAAMPLGHHNLLALWLVAVWPLALLPARWAPSTGGGPTARASLLTTGATAAGLLALLATRSLAGALGLTVQILCVVALAPVAREAARLRRRRILHGSLLAVAVLVVTAGARLWNALHAGDASFSARWRYLEAALAGWWERPLLGWGPGGSAWTLGLHLDRDGLPAHQIVTDPHSLPLDVLYETGMVGALVLTVLAGCWIAARRTEAAVGGDAAGWRAAADLGLVGLGVTSLFAGFFDVLAVWWLWPLLLGARLAAAGGGGVRPDAGGRVARGSRRRLLPPPVTLVAALVVFALALPVGRSVIAHRLLEEGVGNGGADAPARLRALQRASGWDPGHPLVGMALGRERLAAGDDAGGRLLLEAARSAVGLAPLYLEAGAALRASHEPGTEALQRAGEALRRACSLDGTDAMAPYLLATLESPDGSAAERELAVGRIALALVAEPRLLAAPELLARPDLRREAVAAVDGRHDVPVGWRAALIEAERRMPPTSTTITDVVELVLHSDRVGETSLSLHAFRRSMPPTLTASIAVDGPLAAGITMPPLHELPEAPSELADGACRWRPVGSPALGAVPAAGRGEAPP